jgi:hypothetical protein
MLVSLKRVLLALSTLGIGTVLASPKEVDRDDWVGKYRTVRMLGSDNTSVPNSTETTLIRLAPSAHPLDLTHEQLEERGLGRWSLTTLDAANKETSLKEISLQRLRGRDYAGMGWESLHKKGQIDCLEGRRFFICRTLPDTTVIIGTDKAEAFYSKTGIFVVVLHKGSYELERED